MINKDQSQSTIDYNEFILLCSKVNEMYEWYQSQKMHPSNNRMNISRFEGEAISRNYRVYPEVLEEFKEFCETHKEYRVQELISQALKEFIDKYK